MVTVQPPTPADRLRGSGLRVTSQRRVILGVFDEPARGHLSAEQVFDEAAVELPELARATVYNTLNDFVTAGLLRKIDGFGPLLFDRNVGTEHHHFHCRECGGLFDVEPAGVDRLELAGEGFAVERTEVLFKGICASCAAPASG